MCSVWVFLIRLDGQCSVVFLTKRVNIYWHLLCTSKTPRIHIYIQSAQCPQPQDTCRHCFFLSSVHFAANGIIVFRSILRSYITPCHTNITSYSILLSSRTRLLTPGHTNLNRTEASPQRESNPKLVQHFPLYTALYLLSYREVVAM